MYTKYEEMRAIRQIMQNYANNQKHNYNAYVTELKSRTSEFSMDIDSDKVNGELSTLESNLKSLRNYKADYQKALAIISEINKAIMCYEQGYTQENIQSGLADERAKEGNRIFYEIRTKNPEYKEIMEEIAYGLFVAQDPMIKGLGLDFDAKVDELNKAFEAGRITKDTLIYYVNMCNALMNNKGYVEYMSQFQQKAAQGINK